ncbi:hypothetical protein STEG23_020444, partial [Scotinomys teguina]
HVDRKQHHTDNTVSENLGDICRKLYSSMDFGRRWQLVHERITPNRFYCMQPSECLHAMISAFWYSVLPPPHVNSEG